jgi:hypothetical protein
VRGRGKVPVQLAFGHLNGIAQIGLCADKINALLAQ